MKWIADQNRIESILHEAYIEGLLKLGAPSDEYASEARGVTAIFEQLYRKIKCPKKK